MPNDTVTQTLTLHATVTAPATLRASVDKSGHAACVVCVPVRLDSMSGIEANVMQEYPEAQRDTAIARVHALKKGVCIALKTQTKSLFVVVRDAQITLPLPTPSHAPVKPHHEASSAAEDTKSEGPDATPLSAETMSQIDADAYRAAMRYSTANDACPYPFQSPEGILFSKAFMHYRSNQCRHG